MQSPLPCCSRRLDTLDERLKEIKRDLPAHGIIGYVGEGGSTIHNSEEGTDYLMIQYCLAPLIIDRSIDHDLVIGIFPNAESSRNATVDPSLALLKNYDNGIVLFSKVHR